MGPRLISYPPPESRHNLLLPIFVSSNSSPVKSSRYEPAGFSFHSLALQLLGLDLSPDDTEETNDVPLNKEEVSAAASDSFHFKGKKKSPSSQGEQDHYSLLGLAHLRYLATEEQIRKSYRECALKFHPDKQAAVLLAEETEEAKETRKEEIDHHFKAIQKAYEVLIDPVKRRIYDSTDEFDDAVPGDCSPQDFFKVYGPVFVRNAKWSVVQPVPTLGDENTLLELVDKFYDFWNCFKSWREFPDANEYDLEEAESREHKRWMERQNAKLSEKARKEESARIRLIVENAFKKDPRILKRKEEEKAEKLRKKEAKIQARKEKEEEAARLLEEERLRKEQEEKKAAEEAAAKKKFKEREKKLLRKEKSRLRTAASDVILQTGMGITEDDVENLCTALDIDELRQLCEKLEGNNLQERSGIMKHALGNLKNLADKSDNISSSEVQTSTDNSGNTKKPNTLDAPEKKERPWNKEEIELLRKAIQKYPKGTSQRWEVISNYMGTNRTVEEILKAIKTVLLQKPDSSKAFDSFLEKRKVGNVVIASPLSTRDETSSATVSSSYKDSIQNMTSDNPKENTNAVKIDSKPGERDSNESEPSSNGKVIKDEQDIWSDGQETALIKALKAFPKETPQRWDRISAAVPGKTKSQCFRKFTELKENFRSKKAAE